MVEKEDKLTMRGKVIETLPDAKFKVQVDNGNTLLCHISGKIRKFNIRILLGDTVDIDVSVYDLTKGIITYRHKKQG